MSPLKIKIPIKNMRKILTNTPIIHSVYSLCVVAPTCFGITLPISGNVPNAWVRETHHVTRNNTPIHNILSTAPLLSISQSVTRNAP
jgi:hypothetical protein